MRHRLRKSASSVKIRIKPKLPPMALPMTEAEGLCFWVREDDAGTIDVEDIKEDGGVEAGGFVDVKDEGGVSKDDVEGSK
jgi:hypothetical protein